MTLPAGNYLVTARTTATNFHRGAHGSCDLHDGARRVVISAWSTSGAQDDNYAPVALTAVVTVTAPSRISLGCDTFDAGVTADSSALAAVKVTNVH